MEMQVRLTTPEALHGVLAVLHARRVQVRHLRYDGNTLRVGLARLAPSWFRRSLAALMCCRSTSSCRPFTARRDAART